MRGVSRPWGRREGLCRLATLPLHSWIYQNWSNCRVKVIVFWTEQTCLHFDEGVRQGGDP